MSQEEDIYNEIFSALKHPIRRRILTILEENPQTFTSLLNDLGIDSGLLTYHLENLGSLIGKTDNGKSGLEFGIMNSRANDFNSQAGWCAATIIKNRERWDRLRFYKRI